MTEKIRALVVDDEPLARRRIKQFLGDEPDVEVVGECEDGLSAVEAVARLAPDLLFLDVQMPRLDGFGVVARVGAGRVPAVVFVTAFDEFALRAFDAHALDYLVKPFDRERFGRALARAREQVGRVRAGDLEGRLGALLRDVRARPKYLRRLPVKTPGRTLFLPVEEIDWVEAADNYLRLHAGRETHLVRETMGRLEAQLDPERFVRIHRSTLVNVERVREMRPTFSGDQVVTLEDGTRLAVSRGYRDRLLALLGDAD